MDSELLMMRLHDKVVKFCKEHNIAFVGKQYEDQPFQILSGLTGIKRTKEEGQKLLGGNYCLTTDNLLKMLAIIMRLRSGLPVVLSGECGCGKTMLIEYLCAWMNFQFLVLDLHGGTKEHEICSLIDTAESTIAKSGVEVCVFLDEINACLHMGLLSEIICQNSMHGRKLNSKLRVIAAMNPYRMREHVEKGSGLVFKIQGDGVQQDDLSQLVYRVHPVPQSFLDLVYDFGALTGHTERLYIATMVETHLKCECTGHERELIQSLLCESQVYVRKIESDLSAASLRDVRRCLELTNWFLNMLVPRKENTKICPLACAITLALAFVYYYRLPTETARRGFWKHLRANISFSWVPAKKYGTLSKKGGFSAVLKGITKRLCDHIIVDEGIAMNAALAENLFVTIICILNRLPVFIVGRPGSSKTLTLQVIASNLQGAQSPNEFWRKFPAIQIFPYQCSPLSSSEAIQHQFDMALRFQEFAQNTVTVLLLDEVGLAEHSPEMPLKVLHKLLVDPPIAIVGLSNWVLDPAKMNRSICLNRPEPSVSDIEVTGRRIFRDVIGYADEDQEKIDKILGPLSQAYLEVWTCSASPLIDCF